RCRPARPDLDPRQAVLLGAAPAQRGTDGALRLLRGRRRTIVGADLGRRRHRALRRRDVRRCRARPRGRPASPAAAALPARRRRPGVPGLRGAARAARERAGREAAAMTPEPPVLAEVSLTVNGVEHTLAVDTRTSLLDLLRERLGLTGSKKGCDHGQCGACTMLLDGRQVNGCLVLAVACAGGEVVSVEGLAQDGELHPLQRAFIEHDAFQCGYCTPGQICSAAGMQSELAAGWPSAVTDGEPELTGAEIRERMSGNIPPLRRLPESRRGDPGDEPVRAFRYERARDAAT